MTRPDDAVLAALQQVLDTVDAPPQHVLEQARGALAWRDIAADLAELVYDSGASQPTGVRGGEDARQITFRSPGLEIEVEVVSERVRTVLGQLVPAQEAVVELRDSERVLRTRTDALGRFTFDGVARGPIKLDVVTAAGTRVQTEGMAI